VAGAYGLPATGVKAVAGNVTVVYPTSRGYVFVGPTATSTPSSSTINFPAGDIRANNFIVPVADDGTISAVLIAGSGATDLIIDISGYYTSGGSQYHTLVPARIMDTRSGLGLGTFSAGVPQTLQVAGNGGVPTGASAVTANLTVTQQSRYGFASVGPSVDPSTPFSNLNFPSGDNRANGLVVPLANDGSLQLVYGAADGYTTALILDVSGYYK
jgi:hypothetical protein